jgi:phosphoserine phosphatase RsbU/P
MKPGRATQVVRALTQGLVGPLAEAAGAVQSTSPDQLGKRGTSVPAVAQQIADITYAVGFRPRGRIGGDYFSVTEIRPGVGRFIVADVAGHDLSAVVVVAVMRIARAASYNGPPRTAHQIITMLNDLLIGDLARLGTFITGTIVEVDSATGQITSYNCGHPPPHIRTASGAVRHLAQESTLPMGVAPDLCARPAHDHLEPGDSIILYTDGVIEARNARGTDLTIAGLGALIADATPDATPSDLLARIERGIETHRGGAVRTDDETVLIMRRESSAVVDAAIVPKSPMDRW